MKHRSLRHAASLSALLLASSVAYAAGPTYKFDIRGATLSAALKQFANQTGLQIAYFTKVTEGHSAPVVSGTLTAEEALRALLNASGLTFERLDEGTIAIHDASATSIAATGDPIAMAPRHQPYSVQLVSTGAAPPPASTASASTSTTAAAESRNVVTLDEVVVTGTNIRGVQNDTAPVMTFDRNYIERSGYSNMMELVDSLPINFKGGASGATEMAPFGNASNYGQNLTRGTGFNLRGLGSVATLTLINGRRVAPSAQGQFIDMSTIPLSAVERIEILTDGASAIYGADAVAGVVNIILRKDFQGAETGLHYGSDSEGSVDEQRLSQTVGANWQGGNALVVAEYYQRDPLDVGDRDFIMDLGAIAPTYLLPDRELATMLFSLGQELTEKLDLSSTVLYSYEEVGMAQMGSNNVLGTQSPITNQWSATLGLGYDAFADWRVSLDGTAAQVATQSGFEYLNASTGQPLLLIKDYHDRFKTWSLDLKADGSLFELPAGAVRLAIGTSYREDDLRSTRVRVVPATGFEVRAIDSRDVKSAFAELYVPLIGEQQGFSMARRVDLSLAGRYDRYSDFGSTTNPKIGVVWTPVEGLDFRAAYSSSFRAPTVAEKALVTRGVQVSTESIDAPDGSGQQVPIFALVGSAPLVAEESDNFALGFTFRPASAPGAEFSVNYFDIDYTNRISQPPYDNGVLSRRADFGELVTDLADDAAAQAYLDQRLAMGDTWIDWVGTGVTGVRHVLDFRQKNAARTQTSGFDVSVAYNWQRDADAFSVNLNVTHLTEILTSLTSSSTAFDQVDRYNQPLDWRARAMGTWTRGGLNSTLVVNYADGYINDSLLFNVPVDAWTTLDLNVSYDFDAVSRSTWLAGTKLALGISNVFDEKPPRAMGPAFSDPQIGFDAYNADAMGRFITLRMSKRW